MNLKTVKICLSLTLMLMLASAAQAAPSDDKEKPGKDRPGGPVPEQLDPEKQELARKLFSDFEMKIEPLRTELHSKNLQFEAFSNSASIDKETIVTLADEIAELNSKLRQEHRAFMDKCREELGPDAELYFKAGKKGEFWLHGGPGGTGGPMHPGPALPPPPPPPPPDGKPKPEPKP